MALFGPKSKEYGDLNRKSIIEIDHQVEETKEEVKVIQSDPFSGSDPGLVPTSDETTQAKYLRGDGQWGTPAGGGGGTENYEDLANKPAIDGTELTKNSTSEDLGLAKKTDLPSKTSDLDNDSGFITNSDIPPIPSKTSDLQNDSGFINSESDPTVPSWAKQQNPPTPDVFDGSKNGLVPKPTTSTGKFLKDNGTWDTPASGGTSDYADLSNKPQIEGVTLSGNKTASDLGLAKTTDIPSKTSDLDNDSGFINSESDPTVPSWAKQQNPPTPATFDGSNAGLVPAPASGDSGKFLKSDGSWDTPSGGDGIIPGYVENINITSVAQFVAKCNSLKKNPDHLNINCSITNRPVNSLVVIYADYKWHILSCANAIYYAPYCDYDANYRQWMFRSNFKFVDSSKGTEIFGVDQAEPYTTSATSLTGNNYGASWTEDISYGRGMLDTDKKAEIFVTPGTVIYKDHGGREDYANSIVEVPITGTYFYSDSAMTEQITPEEGKYYMDIPTGDIYYYDGSDFVLKRNNTLTTNYSTDEQLIGIATNGKPLYEKTFTGDTGSISNAETVINIGTLTNIDDVLSLSGTVGWGDNSLGGHSSMPYFRATNNYATIASSNGTLQLYLCGSWYSNNTYFVTMRYTKTTDPTPNS